MSEADEIVRENYEKIGCKRIAKILNDKGIPGPKGEWRLWDVTSIARKLKITQKYKRKRINSIYAPPLLDDSRLKATDLKFTTSVFDYDEDVDDCLGFSPYRGPI